ncbi:Glutathione S-transferase [Handroanthus impetiginosus]|uniref:Glutathione S-transferase n=1 Tax=Handroanthus impetiginosus TaxID=429701 RepID=A0A2G9HI05_9LAMI|nr:Glutathione S-transferase [Handroanthus impetiginosus]
MEKKSDIKLLRSWFSCYCTRVELALKLKGISYVCIEEDLGNKSDLLLKHNYVHQKVPVLLHNEKTIAESLIILEYIDECWTNTPKLLPDDPYERSKARFWANYFDQKYMASLIKIFVSKDKEQEKAIEEFSEILEVFEQGISRDFPQGTPFNSHNSLGFLDIVVGSAGCNYKAFFEALRVDYPVEKNPNYFSWMDSLREGPLMKDTLPPHDKLVAKIKEKFNLENKS